MTGKCKPAKVSRTVSTSPLTLYLTVMCTPGAKVLQLGASAQVANVVAVFDTSTLSVATPAPVVVQPGLKAKEFPTLRLSESPRLASVVRTVVLHRSGWSSREKNRRWQRPSTYNGTQVLCCRIYRYCPSLLWQ